MVLLKALQPLEREEAGTESRRTARRELERGWGEEGIGEGVGAGRGMVWCGKNGKTKTKTVSGGRRRRRDVSKDSRHNSNEQRLRRVVIVFWCQPQLISTIWATSFPPSHPLCPPLPLLLLLLSLAEPLQVPLGHLNDFAGLLVGRRAVQRGAC